METEILWQLITVEGDLESPEAVEGYEDYDNISEARIAFDSAVDSKAYSFVLLKQIEYTETWEEETDICSWTQD